MRFRLLGCFVLCRDRQVTEIMQNSANTVELPCHGSRTRIETMPNSSQLLIFAGPSVSPHHMLLQIRALPAGMVGILFAKTCDPLIELLEGPFTLGLRGEYAVLDAFALILLSFAQLHANLEQLRKIPVFTCEGLLIALQCLLQSRHLRLELPCRGVCLPLRE